MHMIPMGNRHMPTWTFLAVLSSAVFVLILPALSYAGFGVSPPLIQEDKLVPGITLERIIYLVQGTPEKDLQVKLEVDSSVKDWVSFPQGNPVTIPKGVQQYPLAVTIAVPEDAKLGKYKGVLRVTTVPVKADEAGEVAIAIGGIVNMDLEVGNNIIYDLQVRLIKILNVKEGGGPEAAVTVVNNGNTPVAPDTATFELFNKFGDIRLAYAESEDFEPVPAFHEKIETVRFPMEVYLAPGEYWGHVKIYKDRELIKELRTVFNVTEKAFLEKYFLHMLGSGLALVLLVVFFLKSRRRSGR